MRLLSWLNISTFYCFIDHFRWKKLKMVFFWSIFHILLISSPYKTHTTRIQKCILIIIQKMFLHNILILSPNNSVIRFSYNRLCYYLTLNYTWYIHLSHYWLLIWPYASLSLLLFTSIKTLGLFKNRSK